MVEDAPNDLGILGVEPGKVGLIQTGPQWIPVMFWICMNLSQTSWNAIETNIAIENGHL